MSKRHSRAALAALALIAFIAVSAPLAAEGKPWYATRLAALGFQVYASPRPAQDFVASGLDGSKTALSSLKGKIVLLNFWATWCPPCKAEMPSIEALWKTARDKAFTILALSDGESPSDVSAFIKKNGYTYPVFVDPAGSVSRRYGVQGIPTTYVIDKRGMVIARVIGGIEYDTPEALSVFAELADRP